MVEVTGLTTDQEEQVHSPGQVGDHGGQLQGLAGAVCQELEERTVRGRDRETLPDLPVVLGVEVGDCQQQPPS